ncbi:hypothetical protein BDV18DRAFT_163487 [Aspergillus unguis]
MSLDSPANLTQHPGSPIKYQQIGMTDHVGADERCSIASNGTPNDSVLGQEIRPSRDPYSQWHVSFPSTDSTTSDLSNVWSRPTSQASHTSHHWRPHKLDNTSESNFALHDLGSEIVSVPTPDLVHPVPRYCPYTVTSYFAPEKASETMPGFGPTEALHEDCMQDSKRCLMPGSEWTSDGSGYSCLVRQSPGTSSVTSFAEKYTPGMTASTHDSHSLSPWPSVKDQVPWGSQTSFTSFCKDENAWSKATVYSDINQHQGHFDQCLVANENINGLPKPGPNIETYVQPSSILEPYGSTCPSFYLNNTPGTKPEHRQVQRPESDFVYQSGLHQNDSTESFFSISGTASFQPIHASRQVPWTSDARNALLIEYKRRGLSYKDIKRIGGFKEAESTLRGRFRTLTKSKEQRVRKPHWHDNDVRLLCEAVEAYSDGDRLNPYSSRSFPPAKIPWKKVAQYIWTHGGSYHFGNSTCKKKWCEVQNL